MKCLKINEGRQQGTGDSHRNHSWQVTQSLSLMTHTLLANIHTFVVRSTLETVTTESMEYSIQRDELKYYLYVEVIQCVVLLTTKITSMVRKMLPLNHWGMITFYNIFKVYQERWKLYHMYSPNRWNQLFMPASYDLCWFFCDLLR